MYEKKWFRIWLVVAVVWWLLAGAGLAFEHSKRAAFCGGPGRSGGLDVDRIGPPWEKYQALDDCQTVRMKSPDGFGPGRLILAGKPSEPGRAKIRIGWGLAALATPVVVLALLVIARRTGQWIKAGK